MKSYEPTDKLKQAYKDNPELAEAIEKLCFGVMATRGVLMTYEQNATLSYVTRLIEPWVRFVDPIVERNRRTPEQARKSVMKRWGNKDER